MIGCLAAALVLLGQTSPATGRFEMGERLKDLDQVWSTTKDKARRTVAVPKVNAAVIAFFKNQPEVACKALDEASAALQGREASPEDAVTIRFDPPFAEPRTPAKLRISWAYMPTENRAVRIQVGRQSVVATPGRPLTIEVRPEVLNPEILQNPEVGYVMPVQVGAEARSVFLSIIKKPKERLAALASTKNQEAKTLVEYLQKAVADPDEMENDAPLIQYLFTAELLDEGRLRLDRADSIPLIRQGKTYFRSAFPRSAKGELTVVIGLHGFGGSENMFFEAYGHGAAVTEAMKRGWAFVSPRSSATAVADVLEWIKTRRKQKVARVFIMGHSMGGGFALQSAKVSPVPSGIAVFAPAASVLGPDLAGIPLFVSVGKQDAMAAMAQSLGKQMTGRANSEYEELDPCEHLMVVGDSIPMAYRFFDANAGR